MSKAEVHFARSGKVLVNGEEVGTFVKEVPHLRPRVPSWTITAFDGRVTRNGHRQFAVEDAIAAYHRLKAPRS